MNFTSMFAGGRPAGFSRGATGALCAVSALALFASAPPVSARPAPQEDDVDEPATASRPMVQSTSGSGSAELNAALGRLSRDPRNADALMAAGNAALRLGDNEAALGFFSRADEVSPGNGRVKAQIGSAMVQNDDPYDAIRYFDAAEKAGVDVASVAADRGLAYDLVGDPGTAQRWYQVALSRAPSDTVTRRYALSLAIAGDKRAADTVLSPLVQKQDRPAWRTRAFIMAITGNQDEAVSIAHATMPPDLATAISPYLRYMPRLTAAQQAAAANFGRFPRAADIGRDDPRAAQYAAASPRNGRGADAGLIPVGEPLGASSRDRGRDDEKTSRAKRRRPGSEDVPVVRSASAELPPVDSSQPPVRVASVTPYQPIIPSRLDLPPAAGPSRGLPIRGQSGLAPVPRTAATAAATASVQGGVATFAPSRTTAVPVSTLAQSPAAAVATQVGGGKAQVVSSKPGGTAPVVHSAISGPATSGPAQTPVTYSAPPVTRVVAAPPVSAGMTGPIGTSAATVAPTIATRAPVRLAVASPVPAPGFSSIGSSGQRPATTVPAPAVAASRTASVAPAPTSPPASQGIGATGATSTFDLARLASTPAPSPAGSSAALAPAPVAAAPVAATPFASTPVAAALVKPTLTQPTASAPAMSAPAASASPSVASSSGATVTSGLVPSPPPSATSAVAANAPASGAATGTVTSAALATPAAADFSSAFGDFKPPAEEQSARVAAVDITRIKPVRPKPPEPKIAPDAVGDANGGDARGKDAKGKNAKAARGDRPEGPTEVSRGAAGKGGKAALPSHPSRIWVQVSTGANREAMDGEWRRLARQAPEAFRGHHAFVTAWRQNFRLLTGPFESDAEAQDFLNLLTRAKLGGFMWTSPAGQAIDSLAAK
ncbi:SPOR domain-containing protein [Novosphingobium lentum]|uniref:SPOR domain-containing protein n=1 Tax=Novosphingobium lentum TaxID=145287 RepID=UPI00147061ED|nr:SPOR domain-containing protein [Novosphingobium lentum]